MTVMGNFNVIEVYHKEDLKGKNRKYVKYLCKECGDSHVARYDKTMTSSFGVCKTCSYACRETRPDGHGLSGHRLYSIWSGIVQRTTNELSDSYEHYGGRGIVMLPEWGNNFLSFYTWAISNGYADTLSIDRTDVNGNYEPSNCRWATTTTQARNTRVLQKNNTSGYRGVSLSGNKYVACITVDYKKIVIGYYLSAYTAAITYDTYVVQHSLEHNINFSVGSVC